jgi:hypothetical protein
MLTRFTFACILGVTLTPCLRAQVDQYRVKAAFLCNFARYVEWPEQRFKNHADPFAICVFGESPFGGELEQATKGQVVDGRAITVLEIREPKEAFACHILFVVSSERKSFRSLAAMLSGAGVLTVGESRGFTDDGGVINLKLQDGRIHLEVNIEAATQQHLRISSKLLNLAQIVRTQEANK